MLSPMLDPDWTLPSNFGCRDMSAGPACFWRGQIGAGWNCSECGTGSPWGTWHDNYAAFILHYGAA